MFRQQIVFAVFMVIATTSASGDIASIKPRLQGTAIPGFARSLHQTKENKQLAGSNFTHQSVLTSYLSNNELETYMRGYVGRCGHMARMLSLGKSKENREMWALELSNNPSAIEAKPNARYIGNMHGDEPASRQLLLGLAEWLCQYHTTDARAAEIVNGMHLYLVPTVNPDGFDRKQRHNVAGVDLNRDFPDPLLLGTTGLQPTGNEQPETLALMQWMSGTHFVASVSLHEGAVVANYPWDGMTEPNSTYSASPDDATFRHLARVYADAHTEMHDSTEFAGGITNGAQWYPISGGMQPLLVWSSHQQWLINTPVITEYPPANGPANQPYLKYQSVLTSPPAITHTAITPTSSALPTLRISPSARLDGCNSPSVDTVSVPACHFDLDEAQLSGHYAVRLDLTAWQDWAYVSGQCMELTVEVSQNKWPPAELLPGLFEANLPALLAFPLAAAFSGLRGGVHQLLPTFQGNATDYDIPLQADIMVQGIDHPIQATASGNYYRPLAPGTYNVTAALKGYSTVSAEIKIPKDGRGVVHNFALPCTTCKSVDDSAQWDEMYDEEGWHIQAAIYAFLLVAGGAWVLYALWWWCRARRHSLHFNRHAKTTSV